MQKNVNLVDLVKSFPTSIYLQKSASIQPRTSLSKFGRKFNSLFIRLLRRAAGSRSGTTRCSPASPFACRWSPTGSRQSGISISSQPRSVIIDVYVTRVEGSGVRYQNIGMSVALRFFLITGNFSRELVNW